MRQSNENVPGDQDGVVVGVVKWPKNWEGPRTDEQPRQLRAMVRDSEKGLALDCSLVEIGNSEIINLLMRVRNHAKKLRKGFVLFNVPDTLSTLIQLCNLESILFCESDEESARRRVADASQG